MATSTIKLYRNCNIVPEKNFMVDHIEDYLPSVLDSTLNDFQYQKIMPDMYVKIDMNQSKLSLDSLNNTNYMSIVNSDDSRIYYYFIIEKRWISSNTIEYTCSLDSINTFKMGTDYTFSAQTNVIREHKDRFTSSYSIDKTIEGGVNEWNIYEVGGIGRGRYVIQDDLLKGLTSSDIVVSCNFTWRHGSCDPATFDYTDLNTQGKIIVNINNVTGFPLPLFDYTIRYHSNIQKLKRIIDLSEEGISPVLLGEDKGDLDNNEGKWYLIYEADSAFTEDDPQPVSVYLASDEEHTYELSSADTVINGTDLTANKGYYVSFGYRDTPNSFPDLVKHTDQVFKMAMIANNKQYDCGIEAVDSDKGVYRQIGVFFKRSGTDIYWEVNRLNRNNYHMKTIAKGTTPSISFRADKVITTMTATDIYFPAWYELNNPSSGSTSVTFTAVTTTVTTLPFSTLNRSDPKIMKIIELPYCPIDNVYDFTADTLHNFLKLKTSLNAYTSVKEFDTDFNPINDMFVTHVPSSTEVKNKLYESKLYNSTYYQPKFVYDNFTYLFQNELLSSDINEQNKFRINMAISNTSNSKMVFMFPQYNYKYLINNYNILSVDRNNEVPQFNSSYFNYLKYGYNAEVKAKNANLTKNVISTTVQGLGAIGAYIATAFTKGATVSAAITLTASTIASISNTIASSAQAEQSIADKINESKTQGASISGSDDIGLFNFYSNNKAKLMLWKCTDNMSNSLFDLFHYCGYASNSKKVPNSTSRLHFNYMQCEPQYSTCYVTDEYKKDLNAKFAAGVTRLHKVDGNWDWSQHYENWEHTII